MTIVLQDPGHVRTFTLHLGILPKDLLGGALAPLPRARVHLENVPLPHPVPPPGRRGEVDPGLGLPQLRRSGTGRYAVLFGPPGLDRLSRVVVRVLDEDGTVVPRRLSIPAPLAGATAPGGRRVERACRPVFFAALSRGLPPGTTSLIGRAVIDATGQPAAWARVRATPAGATAPVWRAHADRDGAFQLVVGRLPAATARAPGPLRLRLVVRAAPRPDLATLSHSPTGSEGDPLWQLPIETVGRLGVDDPVEAGLWLPPGYRLSASRTVASPPGAATRLTDPFVLS